MSIKGYVYILTNPSMPGLVKIGKTTRDVFQRTKELYQTGVPKPFTVYHSVYSPDCNWLESYIHAGLDKHRVSPDREFFEISAIDAMEKLEEYLREQVEAWLDDFMPDHMIIPVDDHIDAGGFRRTVYDVLMSKDVVHPDFPSILYEIEGEDIIPAVDRWEQKVAKGREAIRKNRAETNAVELKVVGEK